MTGKFFHGHSKYNRRSLLNVFVEKFVDGYVGSGRMKAEFKPNGKFGYFEKSVKEIL